MDSQSVKTDRSGGERGYDTGKKIKGRKRHAMVDTDGRALKLLAARPIPGSRRRCPAAASLAPEFPFVNSPSPTRYPVTGVAPAAHHGRDRAQARRPGRLPSTPRWVVERFFAWIGPQSTPRPIRSTIPSAEAFLYAASAILMLRRLGRC